jgi:cytochrome c peroxidase
MRTRTAALVGPFVLLAVLLVQAPSRADEIRLTQVAGPAAPEFVARGRELFNDPGLSGDRQWSCADGRYQTLNPAVRAMWESVQKAGTTEKLTDDDLNDLVAFLNTL